ncbi:hypothetical protein FSP39_003802 [Pinctada imbricata]|uniref:Uncharacterized protein n=1 Tax=Pinctada imbricata TaxID=66713 RepID=A0AA88YFQ5_PINIB|nr:hypothetical protein FSP39_003802 [Pinctada imbricata]
MFCLGDCDCNGYDCDPKDGRCYFGTEYNNTNTGQSGKESDRLFLIVLVSGSMVVLVLGIFGCMIAIKRRTPPETPEAEIVAILEILARNLEHPPTQDGQRNRVSFSNSNFYSDHGIDITEAYNYIDKDILDRILAANTRDRGENGDQSNLEFPNNDYAACATLPIDRSQPGSSLQSSRQYHSTDNIATGVYNTLTRNGQPKGEAQSTLTRNGPPIAEAPMSSSVLTKGIKDWNNRKPGDYLRVRNWLEAQKDKTKNEDIYKAGKRRKSKALNYVRRGINSIFRSSRSSFDLKNVQDVDQTDHNRYSLVSPIGLKSQVQLELKNTQNGEGAGSLPLPPDEWCNETNFCISDKEYSQETPANLNDEETNRCSPFPETSCVKENNESKKEQKRIVASGKCHITKGASYS